MLDYNNNPIANAFTSIQIDGEPLMCPVQPVENFVSRDEIMKIELFSKNNLFLSIFQGQNCIDQTFSTSKYVGLIKIMVGQLDIKIEGTHDTVRPIPIRSHRL